MTTTTDCVFCKLGVKNMSKFTNRHSHQVYEDDVCYAVLEREQSIPGYTLVILKEHKNTILDQSITDEQIVHFWRVVQKIGNALKEALGAENVYVCSLCDGVNHFHAHLAPRYKWTEADRARYKELFTARDGEQAVTLATTLNRIGGFWYLGDTEKNFMDTEYMKLPIEKRGDILVALAEEIKACIK
ncbi:HIT family protein [Patescibacteria group bacterium]|nr:HIT family protein [Patescibacteria group bacterium]